jgi:hypothetical protein
MERTTRETWAKRVERWNDSGLSGREYAAELGISSAALKWWKWKLSSTPASARTEPKGHQSSGSRSARKKTVPRLTFVEVKSAGADKPAPALTSTPIEIVLRSGVQLRVTVGFDAPTLERVLDVVERRS